MKSQVGVVLNTTLKDIEVPVSDLFWCRLSIIYAEKGLLELILKEVLTTIT